MCVRENDKEKTVDITTTPFPSSLHPYLERRPHSRRELFVYFTEDELAPIRSKGQRLVLWL
jgi:hypothetical protein